MQTEDLKLLLALEPAWTVSVNRREFVSLRSADIEVHGSTIRFDRFARKITDVQWLRPNVVRVQARTRLRTQPDVLIFYPAQMGNLPFGAAMQRRRRAFQRLIAQAAADYFGTGIIEKQILHSDRQHGIGGAYPRLIAGSRAIIAVDPDESSAVVNGIMRAAIQWSDVLGRRISVVVPVDRNQTIVTRLRALPAVRAGFDWFQWNGEQIGPMNLDTAAPETCVHEYRAPNVQPEVARICALAPALLQPVPHIPGNAISVRLRGLEIARVAEGETVFPMGQPLEALIERLSRQRQHGSRHPLARAYEESWLESNLIGQIRNLLPVWSGCVYPQVPSFTGEDRKIIDLLTVTEKGRLVVIEVKVSADPDLPLQALDYWLAVERHRKAGDFERQGYFQGMDIRDEPALLVMVAPLLAFHRTVDRLTSVLPATVPIMQIGINQTWKKEIKVLRRRGLVG